MDFLKLIFAYFIVAVSGQGASAQCSFNFGDFSASWVVDRGNNVRFQVTKNRMMDNTWTAIAFGYSMGSGLDIAMIKVINGRVVISDEFVNHYGPPMPDRPNIQAQDASYSNGVLRASFSRPLMAMENFVDHSIAGCTPWQFVTMGGMVHGFGVGKHFRDPIMRMVCVEQCRI